MGNSKVDVTVHGQSVMVSVVELDTVYVWWLTVMTVGVGQTVMSVETTVVVVEIWQLWCFLQSGGGGGGWDMDVDVVLEGGGLEVDPLDEADDDFDDEDFDDEDVIEWEELDVDDEDGIEWELDFDEEWELDLDEEWELDFDEEDVIEWEELDDVDEAELEWLVVE